MAQLSDDCFVPGTGLMPAAEALAALKARLVPVVGTERLALQECANRFLAQDIRSQRDVPPHDNSAVDGYAVYFDDLSTDGDTQLPITGRVAAGQAGHATPGPGTATRIFTGAPIPGGTEGPDTVLMQEDCTTQEIDGTSYVSIPPGIARGANRRAQGEDVTAGDTILRTGDRMRPQEIGLAASVGITELTVFKRLSVAVLSTGNEVVEPGGTAEDGQIYDANRHALMAALRQIGCEITDLGIVPDNPARIAETLDRAAATCDAIVSSAGMSVGEEDHLAATIRKSGTLHFWKVAIKPGRPIAFGQVKGTPFIGLPGNPAAMMVTFLRMARPALLRLAGATDLEPRLFLVRAGFDHRKKARRREYVRVFLEDGPDGMPVARKFPRAGAGILSSLVGADGLVELDEDTTQLSEGSVVPYLPFTEVAR